MLKQKIIRNRIKCNLCGDIIESTDVHDYRICKCGQVAVDGGTEYLERGGYRENYTDLSEVEEI